MEPNRTPITAACPLREQWRPELGIVYCARVGSDYELYLWEENIHVHTQCSHRALQQKQATNMPIIRASCQTGSPETSHPRTVKNTFHGYLTKTHALCHQTGSWLQRRHVPTHTAKTYTPSPRQNIHFEAGTRGRHQIRRKMKARTDAWSHKYNHRLWSVYT